MHFTHLRAFQAVALEGGFTRGAKRLGRSQPTITRQVRELEEAFGIELFHRRGRQIELSAVGKGLLAITERLFTTSEEAVELLQAASNVETGHLRVSAVNPLDIMRLLGAFISLYPGVSISVKICNSREALDALLDFRADVAMLASDTRDRRLEYADFGSRPLVVYVRTDHEWSDREEISFMELARQKVIVRETGSQTRTLFERACDQAGLTPRVAMEVNNRDALREAIALGLGAGVVGARGLTSDPRIREIQISDCSIRMYRQIACLQERSSTRIIRSFLEAARELAGDL